jgi:hypothetical protein
MDENRLKKVVQSALDVSYNKSLLISEFRVLQTHMYDVDKGDWVPDSYSLFLDLKRMKDCDDDRNVSSFIESVIGFECVVDFS